MTFYAELWHFQHISVVVAFLYNSWLNGSCYQSNCERDDLYGNIYELIRCSNYSTYKDLQRRDFDQSLTVVF